MDALWFVTKLDDTRVTRDERDGIRLLTEALGPDIWGVAVIVFTFAGKVPEEEFEERLRRRTELIRAEIARAAPEYALTVPSVAADNKAERTPDGNRWLAGLYLATFARLSKPAKLPFLAATATQLRDESSAPKRENNAPPTHIVLNEGQKTELRKEVVKSIDGKDVLGLAGLGALLGTPFGPAGAAVGGVLGAAAGLLAWAFD